MTFRHPDAETRNRQRRVARLVLTLDILLACDRPDEPLDPIDLLHEKRRWFNAVTLDPAGAWRQIADVAGVDNPSPSTMQLAHETVDTQIQMLFEHDAAKIDAHP